MKLKWLFVFSMLAALLIFSAACDCDDDDDDDNDDASPADDDTDYDDDTGDDDDDTSDDDTGDDDTGDDDTGPEPIPEVNCIPPVDYDGDGDEELLALTINSTYEIYRYYLIEPGTYEREMILEYDYSKTKQAGPHVKVADLDGNGVWDLVLAINESTDKGILGSYEVYLNGDFDTPAYTLGPFVDSDTNSYIVDTDLDGLPELLLVSDGACVYCNELMLVDPGEDFAEIAIFGSALIGGFNPLITHTPGEIYSRASNFSGGDRARELLAYREYEDGGHSYAQMIVFDIDTGNIKYSSTPFDTFDGADSSSACAADYDGDGLDEIHYAETYHDTSAEADPIARHYILGGSDFTQEYFSGDINNRRASIGITNDFNGDGIIDPSCIDFAVSGTERFFQIIDGTDGYSNMFSYNSPDDYLGGYAILAGRGHFGYGYDFSGSGHDEVIMIHQHDSAGARTGEIELIDITEDTTSGVLATYSLGESGSTQYYVADIGGDGRLELVVRAYSRTWTGSEWDSETWLYVYTGATMDLLFSTQLGDSYDDYHMLYTTLDLTGDWALDIVVENNWAAKVALSQDIDIYTCDTDGCELADTIDYGIDGEHSFFYGPML